MPRTGNSRSVSGITCSARKTDNIQDNQSKQEQHSKEICLKWVVHRLKVNTNRFMVNLVC